VLRAAQLVCDLHGLIGASALSHSIAGLTRRAAAAIKAQTLTALERERKAALDQVCVTQPGVMRGMDAMYFATPSGVRYALIAADAAVPYRTTVRVAEHYDASLVAELLEVDIRRHGAPLVLRADRARAHQTPLVQALLARHQILLLHGPPRYPCYYGQLERQNREHRAWLAALSDPPASQLQPLLEHMLSALNALWPRHSLHWKTAAAVWGIRAPITLSTRCAFRAEVHNRTRQIACGLQRSSQPADLAERLAIEQTLQHMGYLRWQIGAKC
jgi:transposase InsO family protein